MSQFPAKEEITAESKMPFGKYSGQPIKSLPADYLVFLYQHERGGRITDYLRTNIQELMKQAEKEKKKKRRRYQ